MLIPLIFTLLFNAVWGSTTTALMVKNAVDATQANPANVSLSFTVGRTESASTISQQRNTATASTIVGQHITIQAAGAGKDSALTIQGSHINADNDVTLEAEGAINLLAAQNTTSTQRNASSQSAGIDAAISLSAALRERFHC
jgi:filamentous hemagglutinin